MRVVMLSWEYPPKLIGGIARHVYDLSHALAQQGIEVHVVTADHPKAPTEQQERPGLFIHRVPTQGSHTDGDFIKWVDRLNGSMRVRIEALLDEWATANQPGDVAILHAHDWLAERAAVGLKHSRKLPMLATIHATEHGRNCGIHNDIQREINSREYALAYEAWRIIACSQYMRGEIAHALAAPNDKIDVIFNGVDASKFDFTFPELEQREFRARFADSDQPLVFYVGRFVREKGVQVLLEAVPRVKAVFPKVRFLIVGGGNRDRYVSFTRFLHMDRAVRFTGFMSDDDLHRLYRISDAAVFPSLYEPFGIVALEAMAARTPVVVSDAGGLREIVEHDVTGTITWLNNADSLAWGIIHALEDKERAQKMVEAGYKKAVEIFNWERIARQTVEVYERVRQEYLASGW